MSISEINPALSLTAEKVSEKAKSKRVPGHAYGATLVIIFAAFWTQLVAAVTLVLMWFSWQDPLNLAWPDNERIILMSATLVTVLVVSYVLAGRFWQKRTAARSAFAEIWYTSGAAAGAWFGLPLYLSVTWDHLVGGGHDAFTIITVGALFVGVGGIAGLGLAMPTEPLVRRLYEWGRERGEQTELQNKRKFGKLAARLVGLAFAPLVLGVGGLTTFGLLLLIGPGPLADPTYPGAAFQGASQVNGACLSTILQYRSADAPEAVFSYYHSLASRHKYSQITEPGQLDKTALGLLGEKLQPGPQSASLRYSNTPFQNNSPVSAYSPYRSSSESCRSLRVFITPNSQGGTVLQLVSEKPGHVH